MISLYVYNCSSKLRGIYRSTQLEFMSIVFQASCYMFHGGLSNFGSLSDHLSRFTAINYTFGRYPVRSGNTSFPWRPFPYASVFSFCIVFFLPFFFLHAFPDCLVGGRCQYKSVFPLHFSRSHSHQCIRASLMVWYHHGLWLLLLLLLLLLHGLHHSIIQNSRKYGKIRARS